MEFINRTFNIQGTKVKRTRRVSYDISIGVLLLYYIFIMRGLDNELYITFALMLIWIYISFITDINSFVNALKKNTVIFVCIYLLYTFIISFFFEGLTTSIGYVLGQMTLFIGVFMFNYYKNKLSSNNLLKLFIILICIWVYYCIKALIFYSQNPLAARDIISHQGDQFSNVAIGGAYGLAFGSVILGVSLSSVILKKNFNDNVLKIMFLITLLLCLFISIETGSTITLIAMIIGLLFNLYIFLTGINKKLTKNSLIGGIAWNTLFFSLIALFLVNMRNIGTWILKISTATNSLFASRLKLIGIQLRFGESTGTLSARQDLYKESIETFLQNPIFGTTLEFGMRMNPLIGGHSELVDKLAMLGVAGGIPFLLIYYHFLKFERTINKNLVSAAYIVSLLIMFVLNPFHYPQSNFLLFFILPSLSCLKNKFPSNVNDVS